MLPKLAIVTTHPIQYYAPVFRMLYERQQLEVMVFYSKGEEDYRYDKDFRQKVIWDIPLTEGYPFIFVKGNKPMLDPSNDSLCQAIAKWKPDALLIYGWNFPGHLNVMRYFKKKCVLFFRGDSHLLDEKSNITTLLRRVFLKQIYKYIDFAFYVGANNKAYYIKHGLKEAQLFFAPHAIDNKRFSGEAEKDYEQKAKTWRRSLGIQDNDVVLLFAGKLEPKKAPDLLLKCIQAVNGQNQNTLKLIFAGTGVLEEPLKEQAGNDPNIFFLGFQNQSQMPIVYRLGDLYCLPSKGPGETWGLAVNEAMASSRAVLVSDKVGCSVDLVEEGKTGFVFKVESKKELKLILQKLNSVKLKLMGEISMERIKKWSFEKQVEKIISVLIEKTV